MKTIEDLRDFLRRAIACSYKDPEDAKEIFAEFIGYAGDYYSCLAHIDATEKSLNSYVASEREACAKIAEEIEQGRIAFMDPKRKSSEWDHGASNTAKHIARFIRARSDNWPAGSRAMSEFESYAQGQPEIAEQPEKPVHFVLEGGCGPLCGPKDSEPFFFDIPGHWNRVTCKQCLALNTPPPAYCQPSSQSNSATSDKPPR